MSILPKAKEVKTKEKIYQLVEQEVVSKKNAKIYQLTEVNGNKKKSIKMEIPMLLDKEFLHTYKTILELDKQRQRQYDQVSYLKKDRMNRLNYLNYAKKLDVEPRDQENMKVHLTQRIDKLQDSMNKNEEKLAKGVNWLQKYMLKKEIDAQKAELALGKKLLGTKSLEKLKKDVSKERERFLNLNVQLENTTQSQSQLLVAKMMPLINSFKGLVKQDIEYTDKLIASLEKHMELEQGNGQRQKAQLKDKVQETTTKQNPVNRQPITQAKQDLNDKGR
ncbi:hypothetical protein DUC50_RS10670 [Enterococcus hirae]|uniref:hypothetical protein n=1 Tax=unclassified Enterococcus TaxID=2608891 RepID=UPI001A0519D4|nr:hypothetical protein [Enterococcus hirae]EMF0403906.1 hypothetical protein [Enterococcus hirae]EMF0420449.1 hypothetical protein [Enterococcus hirae]EMF0512455.1 hypothetical protein [Enterococcus hirae]